MIKANLLSPLHTTFAKLGLVHNIASQLIMVMPLALTSSIVTLSCEAIFHAALLGLEGQFFLRCVARYVDW
jgi:hypothetical protein